MTRRESRIEAAALLFERSFDYERTPEEIMESAMEDREEKISAFAKELFLRADENLGDINEKIERCADNWRIDRIDRVSLTVLRLAACEIDYFPEIPIEITVNEALEIARYFGEEDSVGFINGVLGKYAKGVEKPFAKARPLSAETEEDDDILAIDELSEEDAETLSDLAKLDGDNE
jgi:N utilization substance protein B